MTYQELKQSESHESISYSDLLRCEEWSEVRNDIVKRDDNKCMNCGKPESDGPIISGGSRNYFNPITFVAVSETEAVKLEVHHKLYIRDKLPWGYNYDDLLTVCSSCHKEIHDNNEIYVYDENKRNRINTNPCSRCGGSGHLAQYDYYQGGICFKCRGIGRNIPFKII